jgi:hypothetical protein
MTRFYFDHVDHRKVTDRRGHECRTVADARLLADRMAKELGRNKELKEIAGQHVIVIDEGGTEVYRTPLMDEANSYQGSVRAKKA